MTTRIIFMGTPDFATPPLSALVAAGDANAWQVTAVVTQPDRPGGRGRKLQPSPVKVAAQQAGIRVLQPESLNTPAAWDALAALEPDVIVVAAFGQILKQNILTLPRAGCINIHASLLPRWRGAAPVAAAIRAGDAETGVTLMLMDEGLDTGPIIARRAIPIRPDHTRGTLTADLARLGAELLVDTLPAWLAGNIPARPQDNRLATLAPRLKKEEGALNWNLTAVEIERQVRAFYPWPGTFTRGCSGLFKVLAVEIAKGVTGPGGVPPGTIFRHNRQVCVTTGQGVVRLVMVQPAGKKPMAAEAMLNGQPDLWNSTLQPAGD